MKTCSTCHATKPLTKFDNYGGKLRSYCSDCRREKDRAVAAERRRAKGIAQVKGTEAQCQDCGSVFTKMSYLNIRCKPCQREVMLARARAASLKKARERGDRAMGSVCSCAHCGKQFTLDAKKAKYCAECRVLQKKGAIPFMKEHSKKYIAEYMANPKNRRKVLDTANARKRQRRSTDPLYAMIGRVRARLNETLRKGGYTKRSRTHEIIGCDYEFLRGWIESQFKPGMTWENRDAWHLDHRVPLASAKSAEEILRLSHYTNLQPLWAEENQKKGDKLPDEL